VNNRCQIPVTVKVAGIFIFESSPTLLLRFGGVLPSETMSQKGDEKMLTGSQIYARSSKITP
jgi:hypothetical protein